MLQVIIPVAVFVAGVDVPDAARGMVILHEPQPYVPSNPIHENDIERLLSIESESMEGWARVKKTKDATVWRRNSFEEGYPPITKVLFFRTIQIIITCSRIFGFGKCNVPREFKCSYW